MYNNNTVCCVQQDKLHCYRFDKVERNTVLLFCISRKNFQCILAQVYKRTNLRGEKYLLKSSWSHASNFVAQFIALYRTNSRKVFAERSLPSAELQASWSAKSLPWGTKKHYRLHDAIFRNFNLPKYHRDWSLFLNKCVTHTNSIKLKSGEK